MWLALFLPHSVWAEFQLATNVYGGQSIYVEVQSAEKAIGQLKKFYSRLRGEDSVAEFDKWGKKFEQKLGFNIFNPNELKKVGLSPSLPILFTIRLTNEDAEELSQSGTFHIYLPASHSRLLYKTIVDSYKTTEVNKRTGELIEKQKGYEVKKGVYKIIEKNSQTYVLRHKDFVHITNSKTEQAEVVPPPQSLVGDLHYQKATKEKVAWTQDSILRLVSQNQLNLPLKKITQVIGEKAGTFLWKYMKEMGDNLDFATTLLEVNEKQILAHSFSLFEDGFLQKKDGTFSQLVRLPNRLLYSDFIDTNPLFYLKYSSQPKLFSWLLDIFDHYAAKWILEFEQKTNIEIDKTILPALDGSLAIILDELPPFSSLKDLKQWKLFLQLGLKQQGEQQIDQTLEKVALNLNDNSLQKKSKRGGSFWSLKENNKDVLFINKNEITINPHEDFLKSLKKMSGASLLSKTIKINTKEENNYFFYALMNIEKLNNYFLKEIKENQNALLSMIHAYSKNIISLWSYSKVEKNEIVSRFSLNLK